MVYFDRIPREAQIERWQNVLRVLESLPEHERTKHWDMSTWGQKSECGTVACAAGHCGMDPWFRSQGFTMDLVPCNCAPDCDFWNVHIKDVGLFFGDGASGIFCNATPRSVDVVINEVKEHLEELKS